MFLKSSVCARWAGLLVGAVLFSACSGGKEETAAPAAPKFDPRVAHFEDARVVVNLPEGWRATKARAHTLMQSEVNPGPERIYASVHRTTTLEQMRERQKKLPGGAKEFEEIPSPSRCFQGAWVQKQENGDWKRLLLFREQGKLELRVEALTGKKRILEMLEWAACEAEPAAPASGGSPAVNPPPETK